jgi:hypothetical protein
MSKDKAYLKKIYSGDLEEDFYYNGNNKKQKISKGKKSYSNQSKGKTDWGKYDSDWE